MPGVFRDFVSCVDRAWSEEISALVLFAQITGDDGVAESGYYPGVRGSFVRRSRHVHGAENEMVCRALFQLLLIMSYTKSCS